MTRARVALLLSLRAIVEHERGALSEDEAVDAILTTLEAYASGEPLPHPAEWELPWWVRCAYADDVRSSRVTERRERLVQRSVFETSAHSVAKEPPEELLVSPVVAARARELREKLDALDRSALRQVLRPTTEYARGRSVVYVDDELAQTHHVPQARWREYVQVRKTAPARVVVHDTLRAARAALGERNA